MKYFVCAAAALAGVMLSAGCSGGKPEIPDTLIVSSAASEADGNFDSENTVPENSADNQLSSHVHNFVRVNCETGSVCSCGEALGDAGHDYSEADCTRPAACRFCAAVRGEPLGHDFGAADCVSPAICSRCGTKNGEALGHDFTEPTCTEAAVCLRCGTAGGGALGHSYSGQTCTQEGVCVRCGKTAPAVGHDFSAASCTKGQVCRNCGTEQGSALGHSYKSGVCTRCGDKKSPLTPEEAKLFNNRLTDEQNAQALAVAREIAAYIEQELPDAPDIDRVGEAAYIVSVYSQKCEYTMEGNEFSQAYGVFVSGVYSCAGSTKALGLVLSCLGYSWTHVNEHLYTHQWVSLIMDGQEGWADGQIGFVGYGTHPAADPL